MVILYKKDSKGKIRYLKLYVEDDIFYQESGRLNTDNPIIHSKKCTPKNIGKSNETTGFRQAVSEMTSTINKKLDQDYYTLEMLEEMANKQNIL